MKPKPQKNQGKINKKQAANSGKSSQRQNPNFKHKFKPKKEATEKKPNKPEIRKMIRQKNAAEAEAERQKIKQEKEERIKQRLEKTKVISKRTQRGQPLMKDRMQLLLKQIEEMKRH